MKYRIATLPFVLMVFGVLSAKAQDTRLATNTGVAPEATAQTCNAAVHSDLDLYNTDRLSTVSPKELLARRNFMMMCWVHAPKQRQYFETVLGPIDDEIANRYAAIISKVR